MTIAGLKYKIDNFIIWRTILLFRFPKEYLLNCKIKGLLPYKDIFYLKKLSKNKKKHT